MIKKNQIKIVNFIYINKINIEKDYSIEIYMNMFLILMLLLISMKMINLIK